MYEIAYGSKYQQGQDIAEITKAIRADIKAAIHAGHLPRGLKASVRLERFAGGRSIDIRVTALPFNPYNLEWVAWADGGRDSRYVPSNVPRYTPQAVAVLDQLKAIHQAYNFDGSDSQIDYFHVNYYGDVAINWELERQFSGEAQGQAAELYLREETERGFRLVHLSKAA